MRCKHCGGNYKTRELVCPYCETENIIGKLWHVQRSKAELEYEEARKEAGKRISIYVLDRVLSRILLVCVLAMILSVVGVGVFFAAEEAYYYIYQKTNAKEIEATLKDYYDKGEYDELHQYMQKYQLFDREKRYVYSQAALMEFNYDEFLDGKMVLAQLPSEQLREKEYYVSAVLNYSVKVYRNDVGVYEKIAPENEALLKKRQEEVVAFWRGICKITPQEEAMLCGEEFVSYEYKKQLVKDVITRLEASKEGVE